jgi:hypothetical protein
MGHVTSNDAHIYGEESRSPAVDRTSTYGLSDRRQSSAVAYVQVVLSRSFYSFNRKDCSHLIDDCG